MERSGIIKDLEDKTNLTLLIRKEEYKKNWQHPYEVTDYIIQNYKKTSEINIFDIYEK